MKIQWLGQGGFMLESEGTRICIDPYLSDCVLKAEGRPRMVPAPYQPEKLACDLLITTHDHMDHLDPDAIPRMDHRGIFYAGPKTCRAHLLQLGVGQDNLVPLERGQTGKVGKVSLHGVYAEHTEDSIGVVVEAEGLRLYFTGDTLYSDRLGEDAGKVDVLFTCINGRLGNMTDREAVELTLRLKPRLVIPNHFGMFATNTVDPTYFLGEMEKNSVPAKVLPHGEWVELDTML